MIRLAKAEDRVAIDSYCTKFNIQTPSGLTFISTNETGIIDGVICAELRMVVEPMIADNPTIARRLYDTLLGAVMAQGVPKLYLQPSDDKLVAEAERLGFVIIDKGIIQLRKIL